MNVNPELQPKSTDMTDVIPHLCTTRWKCNHCFAVTLQSPVIDVSSLPPKTLQHISSVHEAGGPQGSSTWFWIG